MITVRKNAVMGQNRSVYTHNITANWEHWTFADIEKTNWVVDIFQRGKFARESPGSRQTTADEF